MSADKIRQSQSLPAGAVAVWTNGENSYMSPEVKDRMIAAGKATGASIGEVTFGKIAEKHDIPLYAALQADAREKGEAVPQRLLTELYGLAQGDLPDGDGVSVSVAMWANNWLYELTQPAQASEATLAKAVDNWLNWFRRGDKKDALGAYGKLASAYATYIATSSQETASE
jgi:hypothetical protein